MERSSRLKIVRRRTLLRSSVPVALVGLAGCLDGTSGSNDQTATDERSFDTPAPGGCEQARRPEPTPTEEGLKPQEYPSYPQSLNRNSAERFAEEYETAYQHNHFIAEKFIDGIDSVGPWASATRIVEDAGDYFVGVNGRVNVADEEQPEYTETPTPEPAPTGTRPIAAWYYLTDRFALRKEISEGRRKINESDTPDLQGATVVVCN